MDKLMEALAVLLLTGLLFSAAVVLFVRARGAATTLQLAGSGCLVLVAVFHIFEALGALPRMGWGQEGSIGHYLDVSCAVLGLFLFSIGYLLGAVSSR
ncbi:MAG TPA: hypothetical protein VGV16_02330 [Gammaproteobacteria bacterium]|nr:hypothetical protein [Gammaproteobacteria bacterium]